MKLRLALIAVLVANAGYALWARGDLVGFGLAPAGLDEREPQRLARQIRPEWLQVRKDAKGAAPGTASGTPSVTAPGTTPGTSSGATPAP